MHSIRVPQAVEELHPKAAEVSTPDMIPLRAIQTSRPGKITGSTLLHMQRTLGNAAVQRTLANHSGSAGCSCTACRVQRYSKIEPRQAVQRCAACAEAREEQPATAQRWFGDDDSESADGAESASQPESSGENSAAPESSGPTAENDAPAPDWSGPTAENDAAAPESASGDDSGSWTDWLPDFGDSNEDAPTSDEPQSGEDTPAEGESGEGEVSYGLPADTRQMPSVIDYGAMAGVFDAEGFCKWDNISGDANNDAIVATTLPNGKIKATGTTVMTFSSTAEYTLPGVPASIKSDCEREKYQKAIDTTLRAHEEQHKAAFLTYNGTASAPVNVTADSESALLGAVSAATLDPTNEKRYNAAKAKSAAVDPAGGFKFTPDLSGC